MPSFGSRSKRKLDTCDESIVQVCYDVIPYYDFAVLCGHRSGAEQDELFAKGLSKLRAGQSKHNRSPSIAFDVAPWPIDWRDSLAFARLAGMLQNAAALRGFELRWGGDWDRDGGSRDQTFMDIGHLEIVE